jgi:SAM-dependent methyltransferase
MTFKKTDEPYDRWAEAYRDWWGPILAPSAVRLLDRLDQPELDGGPFTLLDVGTGVGALAIAALERWPMASVIGIDPASRMLRLAADAAQFRAPQANGRLRLEVGSADHIPLPDASVDVAVSSFVIQLVPSRAAALREIARVVRAGGRFASVTWQAEHDPFEPDDAFMDAVDSLGIEPPPLGGGSRPYTTPEAAAAEVRRAGFANVQARVDWLEHRYTAQSYLGVLEHWVETELFSDLGMVMRHRLRKEALRRMRRVAPDRFVWRRPLVSVVARRSERRG